ncbi:aspartyl/asparaginyl beta-hydroxylase domain-containing protein [Pseudoalteromonas sp. SCSIO 43201]|uniref:aspartyl/asparaginyl beta-hydroxylase domain-containing protein n=1 Tax=Pseudoalteromonas sp. SCSIO 43201 TaxID=2822842 RepID=UPI002074EBBC|nr:aspartyl/asparaginyl beta-hydroxylase domain-containing protein [Pseudoalteromonas sp. SCSIO 43201]USD30819.1 aspartyl/asparaginyl beta-hydroxylase domain-containing protein [Pseudoalteromonas sp. SCSIO 43201]
MSAIDTDFCRLPIGINNASMCSEVSRLLTKSWNPHVNHRDYVGDWDVLPLRCQLEHTNAHPILQCFAMGDGSEWKNLPLMDSLPTIRSLIWSLQCDVKSARLMRLKPGAYIKPHRDRGLCLCKGEVRLHVPILANDEVLFLVNGKVVPMAVGELWYINADKTHSVKNNGGNDRVNLVIDCVVNEWIAEHIKGESMTHSI